MADQKKVGPAVRNLASGDVLFREGEVGDFAYQIVKGKVEVCKFNGDEYVTLSGLILPMEKHCKVSIIWRDRNLKNILITLKEVSFWNMIMGEDRELIHS